MNLLLTTDGLIILREDLRMRLYNFFDGEEVAWGENFSNRDVIPHNPFFF